MIKATQNLKLYHSVQTQKSSRSEEVDAIKEAYKESQAKRFAQMMAEVQSLISGKVEGQSFEVQYQQFQDFLEGIGYEGKNLASLSQDEAKELVSEEGFFGIRQTSERIAQFVISGANGDEALLREGRKGILQGLQEAEEIWGEKLPELSYETIKKAVGMIDQALIDGGFSVIDEKV